MRKKIKTLAELKDSKLLYDQDIPAFGYMIVAVVALLLIGVIIWSMFAPKPYMITAAGTVTICIKEAETYKYLYLYNETTEKYHLIQTENLGRIDITTPGNYVLTNTVYSSLRISWWWIAVSAALIFILLVAYVCVQKRHWFW